MLEDLNNTLAEWPMLDDAFNRMLVKVVLVSDTFNIESVT